LRKSSLKRIAVGLGIVLIAAFAVHVWLRESVGRTSEPDMRGLPPLVTDTRTTEPIQPLPLRLDLDTRVVALGFALFSDPQLSRDDSVSCSSCHSLELGGSDHRRTSIGIGGAVGEINAPTVLNSGFNFRQFWNGRAATLEDQVDGPIQNAAELGSSWPQILEKLRKDRRYAAAFQTLYPDGLSAANVRNAIATYERSLVTPSRFDRYLRGDRSAITEQELAGYEIFKSYGCVSCHQGVNVGGNMYQVFGVMHDYFASRGDLQPADIGRYAVTHDPRDRHVFKVPSLRNVARTAPYFHDGSAPTLAIAVQWMGWFQLDRELTVQEIDLLVAFLTSLNGEIPAGAMPASSVAAAHP
jgi:cytochrome c peroxidase